MELTCNYTYRMAWQEAKTSREDFRRMDMERRAKKHAEYRPSPSKVARRFYDKKVDYQMLKDMGIQVVQYQPWQLGLFHPDMEGKLMWYPTTGTLMFEDLTSEDMPVRYRIGTKGQFIAGGYDADSAEPYITEDVYNEVMKVISMQQENL